MGLRWRRRGPKGDEWTFWVHGPSQHQANAPEFVVLESEFPKRFGSLIQWSERYGGGMDELRELLGDDLFLRALNLK